MFEGFLGLTPLGYVHTVTASVGILVGAEQVIRPSHDRIHRWLGYVYVGTMAFADLTALSIFRFTGGITPFHVAAVVNLVFVLLALRPMFQTPKKPTWLITHYYFIAWSYVGLLAAAATELSIRIRPLSSERMGMVLTIVATSLVTVIGAYLIHGRPPRVIAAQLERRRAAARG